ncbi:MAG: hypothetical protein AB8G05_18270 [Oligoflexales bacterium]
MLKHNRILINFFIISVFTVNAIACEETDEEEDGAESSSRIYYSYSKLNLSQNFEATSPKSFKQGDGTSLSYDDNRETECLNAGARDTVPYELCKLSYEIRARFFQASGKDIKGRLDDFEGRINGNLSRAEGGYIPCLDSAYIGGTEIVYGDSTQGEASAYNETAFSYLIPNGSNGISTGMDLTLSCLDSFDGRQSTKFNAAVGRKGKLWSLVEDMSDGKTVLGTLHEDGSINLWYGFGSRVNVDSADDETVKGDPPAIFEDGATIANIITMPDKGLIAMSAIGEYGGECGTRLIMNQTALYVKAGLNRYGACFSGDVFDQYVTDNNLNIDGDNRSAFYEEWENQELCMIVSDSQPQVSNVGMQHCVDSGLVTYEEDGTTVADPFAAVSLPNLSAKEDRADSGALKMRGWMAGQMQKGFDLSNVPKFGWEPLPPSPVFSETEGFEFNSFAFTIPQSVNPEPIKVSAACNADETTRTSSFSVQYELEVATALATLKANGDQDLESLKTNFISVANNAMLEEGAQAPGFHVSVGGAVGATHRSNIAGTVSVSLDGTSVGEGTYTGSTEGLTNIAKADINLTSVPEITANSKFSVTIAGTLTLVCNTENTVERVGAATIGLPSVYWFSVAPES